MQWIRKLLPQCRPGRQFGLHGRVVRGLGMMGDACLCLRCGAEHFEPMRGEECVDADRSLWPEIAEARALPGGIDECTAVPDPEFDRWISQ